MRAALDLVRRIPNRAPRRIADVYKGRGSMRALLARRFPGAEIEAFDLLRLTDHDPNPGAHRLSRGHKFDLICSNGSLEMVPSLPELLPMLVGIVAAGGCLAVEFPNDLYEPTRALTRMIAADGPWAKTLLPIAKTRPFNETMEGPVRSPQSDLRRSRYLGSNLSPRDAGRRGDRRMDGAHRPRALPGGAG